MRDKPTNQKPASDPILDKKNSNHAKPASKNAPKNKNFVVRWFCFGLGLAFLALGIVGIVTPILPTTPFVILAAGCFAKSSPKFHRWLLNHPYFGQYIKNWEEKRAIPRRAKYLAWGMMTLSCTFLFITFPSERLWAACLTSGICLATAIWMARFPDD